MFLVADKLSGSTPNMNTTPGKNPANIYLFKVNIIVFIFLDLTITPKF